jgi:cobalt transporter subunit CbtB
MSAKLSADVQTIALAAPSQRLKAALVAATLGVGLLFVSGFAPATMLHNAAHDWRHSHNFPCH